MTDKAAIVQSANLSLAWGEMFLAAYRAPHGKIGPVTLSVEGWNGLLPAEDPEIRASLDLSLETARDGSEQDKLPSSRATAMTIFPYEAWVRRGRPDWSAYSKLCAEELIPRLRAINPLNRYGTYVGRMIGFTGVGKDGVTEVDQLGYVIGQLRDAEKRPRSSGLQIACFDPAKDLTNQPVRGFPCLQQIGLSVTPDWELVVNAFYPTQYVFHRAYGNYLGLCHLGAFIAHQVKRPFVRLNCFIGQGDLGGMAKSRLKPLASLVLERLSSSGSASGRSPEASP